MTSLNLFPHVPYSRPPIPPEWSTGKRYERSTKSLWTPKPPSWQYTGEPIEQKYVLTKLKLSNVRLNDQLVSKPIDEDLGLKQIQKPFPKEHPYTSHIPRFAVFPKFDPPEDPRRGFEAHKVLPTDAEMPSKHFDVYVLDKTMGSDLRHELQLRPPESEKPALRWHENFDQINKRSNIRKPVYPTPHKTYVPNVMERDDTKCVTGHMQVSQRTANAMRNVERDQWSTTYERAHTGIGDATPTDLDNYAKKQVGDVPNPEDKDALEINSVKTFDPTRPWAGRIGRHILKKPKPQTDKYRNPEPNPNYIPRKTLHEVSEERMLNGREYVNLPDTEGEELKEWKRINDSRHAEAGLAKVQNAVGEPDIPPYTTEVNDSYIQTYLDKLLAKQNFNRQQLEAQNRLKLLESQTPSHDLGALRRKMDLQPDKTQVESFYNHEGKYQRERAGVYRTSYDPYLLQHAMNREETRGDYIMNYSGSEKGVLDDPFQLNQDMNFAGRYGRTLAGSVPQFHDQPAPAEVHMSFEEARRRQTAVIQPQVYEVDTKTQEGGVVLTETTTGMDYSTPKFMQENDLTLHARNDPLHVMSTRSNQRLGNVRPTTGKSVQFSNDVTIAEGAGAEPIRLSSAPMSNLSQEKPYPSTPRPESTPGNLYLIPAIKHRQPRFDEKQMAPPIVERHSPSMDFVPALRPKIMQSGLQLRVSADPSRKAVTPPTRQSLPAVYDGQAAQNTIRVDMSTQKDTRFNWYAGCGTPRPQSSIIKLQNSFTKSDASKRFHKEFPEKNPYLSENLVFGKQHHFSGYHAQVLRGTPIKT